ncbi:MULTISPECIES: PP2C family protein-serine/threonine phosphatase [unclassified Streptomyces]|uniref:Serine/threonine-protein phosphatase n=1 Tax=Streptomyces sp. NBC_00119 TaxID=2975659 RepID=A0AAU1TWD0_9ACTN|nr:MULTISPECIES: PP2C family protein-serine/threonine phosphatase [unclassified Streptomyces]MCX4648162.1 serine/threonine-protein phosphatase [Streptomyces sp. NBC_01446]MCX5323719.1 serine/threonine-protein phosphatase [Streptomyces sp. NBC_00120]
MPQRLGGLRRPVRGGRALIAIPIAWIVAVSVVDDLSPSNIYLGSLLVAAPAITPLFGGPWSVGLVAALAVVALTASGLLRDPEQLLSSNDQAQIIALVLVGTALVIFCVVRERRAKELAQVRYVSEAAQRVVLPPLPKEIGPLRVASLYLAAEAEAQIGGDLYAATRTTAGTRLIVGDVQGKGMTAVNDAALLLGAFRIAAHRQANLGELVAYLDRSVCWDLMEPGETNRYGETFITANILDIPDQDGRVQMISCGHPPPIVQRNGRPTTMDTLHPAPPMGLGELAHPRYHVDSFPFEPGDLLLLYTDGVTEARDSTGTFYPLAERITGWTENDPDAFLGRLRRDLLRHVGGHLNDDAAVIVIERTATRRA